MVSLAAGHVVLVPFPFSDLSQSKLRPAVVLASAGRGDWILSQITSKPYGDLLAIPIGDQEFSEGSLKINSFVRPGKLFTASDTLMLAQVGILNEAALQRILAGVIAILQGPKQQTTA